MRRDHLPPPRRIVPESVAWEGGHPSTVPSLPAVEGPERAPSVSPPEHRGRLDPATEAEPRRRYLFHPRRGWVRRFERAASQLLSRFVFPQVPGVDLPYSRQLRRELMVSEADVELRDLPRGFEGATVLLISDPHAGPFVSPHALREAFERLQALEPDLILLAGDLTTSRLSEFASHRDAFRVLSAPCGVYAVLGNHDHYTGRPEELRRQIEQDGISVLHNRSVVLTRGGDALSLAGVDDALIGEPDLDAALRDTNGPVILLSHNPDLLFDAVRRRVALMLSGHTHGGQVRIPKLPVLVRQSRYRLDYGRFHAGETELVVSRGLGVVGVPCRVACPPEAVLLTLRAS